MSSPESNQNKTIEEKPKEDTNNIEINNQNSSLSNQEEPLKAQIESSSSTKEQQQENQAELSEIETGSTNQPDFDEIINFGHTFLNYRITKTCPDRVNLENTSFELLTTNIFIYSGDVIDFSTLKTNISNSDAVKNILQKINSYKGQDIQSKKTIIENIPYYTKTIGLKETIENIVPIISDLTREKEVILLKFFEIFPKFIDEIVKFGDNSYFILTKHLIPLIREYLIENNGNIYKKNPNMVKSISDGLVYLSKYLKPEDRDESSLSIAISMAQDDNEELKRVTSVSLFGALIPYIDKTFFNQFIIPQIVSLTDDPSGNVRKEVANQLYNISQNVSKNVFQNKILLIYEKLSKDTLWFVKKVAVEILPKITKLCDTNIIIQRIKPIFQNFAKEERIEVKISVVEALGEFISLLDKKESNNFTEFLEFYIKTVQKFSEKNKKDYKQVLAKCAFNFPVLIDFFGKDSWPKLKPSFIIMAQSKDESIKLPLAASIGDISNILGPELTEEDLLEYVDNFFHKSSQNSEMKLKILENLPKIIRQIHSNNKKNTYLELIKYMIVNNERKWRKRLQYAKIIGKFNGCFSEDIIYKRVFPIGINFCFDDISQVRSHSASYNSKLILQLISGKDEYKQKTLIIIKSFAQSINYKYRQLFIYMSKHLFENEKIFEENISQLLIDLAYDQVPNVKIVLAKFIVKMLTKEKYKHLINNDTIKKIVKILKNDKNKEIVSYMDKIKNLEIEDIDVEIEKNVNWKFIDNMKFVSNEFGITKNVPLNSNFKDNKFKNETNKEDIIDKQKDKNEINIDENNKEINEEIKKEEPKEANVKEEDKKDETVKKDEKKEENFLEENKKDEENKMIDKDEDDKIKNNNIEEEKMEEINEEKNEINKKEESDVTK